MATKKALQFLLIWHLLFFVLFPSTLTAGALCHSGSSSGHGTACSTASRRQFLQQGAAATPLLWLLLGQQDKVKVRTLSLPLKFLSTAGCLAVPIVLNDSFRYWTVVDTCSPFLTCPDTTLLRLQPTKYKDTNEQYGESIGTTKWKRAKVQIQQSFQQTNVVLATTSERVIQDTGGLFLGMIFKDDLRPGFLQQTPYSSFRLDYPNQRLDLSRDVLLSKNDNNDQFMSMYDLTRHGPNLHHYAVKCNHVTMRTNRGEQVVVKCSRPVVVVIDTGLTGCVLSDSWKQDLPCAVGDIRGMRLVLGENNQATVLESDDRFWNLACFRLPWFTLNEENHPHIIAAGGTFLCKSTITVDARERRLLISA